MGGTCHQLVRELFGAQPRELPTQSRKVADRDAWSVRDDPVGDRVNPRSRTLTAASHAVADGGRERGRPASLDIRLVHAVVLRLHADPAAQAAQSRQIGWPFLVSLAS